MMREIPLSLCERGFILKAIPERKRIDGRQTYDYRRLEITFGVDRGCCQVTLGNTRVLAQVSCEVVTPKQTRPSEGLLYINVELSPMAAPHLEAGRQSEEGIEMARLLERCLKESRCIDTESLCIMSGLKVWQIRCDIHILNDEGNILDCSSIAAITALAHFRRPDISVSGENITIHTFSEKDPLGLIIHHMPLFVTFAFYFQGKYLLVDPSDREEKVMEGKLIIGMNKHRELCTLQMTGSMLLLKDQVMRCSEIAFQKVKVFTKLIQEALMNDSDARAIGKKCGIASLVDKSEELIIPEQARMDTSSTLPPSKGGMRPIVVSSAEHSDNSDMEVSQVIKESEKIGEGGQNTWTVSDSYSDDEVQPGTQTPGTRTPGTLKSICVSSDDASEEDETCLLEGTTLQNPKSKILQVTGKKNFTVRKKQKETKKK